MAPALLVFQNHGGDLPGYVRYKKKPHSYNYYSAFWPSSASGIHMDDL
jgi:hypothetical protein